MFEARLAEMHLTVDDARQNMQAFRVQRLRRLDAPQITDGRDPPVRYGEIADTPARLWRGEWMCSRVYAVLDRAEPALWHARRAVTLVESGGADVEDWDRPAVYEAMARASLVAGDAAEGAAWKAKAAALAAALADADDREVIERDLATLPG